MDCKSFAKKIMEMETTEGKGFEDRELRRHLLTCPRCEEFMRNLWSGLPEEDHSNLTQSILARTSGKSCGQASGLMCDLVDDILDDAQAQLVHLHLAHCPECSRTVAVLTELKHALPELAELQPAPGFTRRVLAALPIFEARQPGWKGKVRAWFANLPQRPRFSLEAAYLGTLLILLLFGNPFASLPETSPRLLAGITDQSGVVQVAHKGYDELAVYTGKSLDAVQLAIARVEASGQSLQRMRMELSGKIATCYAHGQSTVKSMTKFFEQKGSSLKKKLQPQAPGR